MKITRVLSLCTLLAASAATLSATPITYTATLSGANEAPTPTNSAGVGTATYTLDGNLLTIDLIFSGLSANAVAGHIHCCAPLGKTAPVVVPFAGLPSATSGEYKNTFDLSTFAFSGGGSEAALIAGLNSGQAYTNVHTSNFPGGEIQGQIEPAAMAATPEPSSLLLVFTGLGGVIAAARRRIKA